MCEKHKIRKDLKENVLRFLSERYSIFLKCLCIMNVFSLLFRLYNPLFFHPFVFLSLLTPGVCSYLTKGRFLSTTWSQRPWWALGWSCCGCQGYCCTSSVWRLLAPLLKGNMSNRFVMALPIKGSLHLKVICVFSINISRCLEHNIELKKHLWLFHWPGVLHSYKFLSSIFFSENTCFGTIQL